MATAQRIVGIVLAIMGGLPLMFLPVEIIWAVGECGPVNSSCHHFPYRLVAASLACLVIFLLGFWLAMKAIPKR